MEAYIVFERSVRSSSRLVRRWSKHVRDRFDLPSGTFSDDFLSTSFTVSSELVAKQLPERSVLALGKVFDTKLHGTFTVGHRTGSRSGRFGSRDRFSNTKLHGTFAVGHRTGSDRSDLPIS